MRITCWEWSYRSAPVTQRNTRAGVEVGSEHPWHPKALSSRWYTFKAVYGTISQACEFSNVFISTSSSKLLQLLHPTLSQPALATEWAGKHYRKAKYNRSIHIFLECPKTLDTVQDFVQSKHMHKENLLHRTDVQTTKKVKPTLLTKYDVIGKCKVSNAHKLDLKLTM